MPFEPVGGSWEPSGSPGCSYGGPREFGRVLGNRSSMFALLREGWGGGGSPVFKDFKVFNVFNPRCLLRLLPRALP